MFKSFYLFSANTPLSDNPYVIAGSFSLLVALITYFGTKRKTKSEEEKNKAEASDLISQSAINLMKAMEDRVKPLEEEVAKLKVVVSENQNLIFDLTKERDSSRLRILALEQEIAWLLDQLPKEIQEQYRLKFKTSGFLKEV